MNLPAIHDDDSFDFHDLFPQTLPGDDVAMTSKAVAYYGPDGQFLADYDDYEKFHEWLAYRQAGNGRYLSRFHINDVDLVLSTAYLAINHQYLGGPPLVWETMVFTSDEVVWADFQARYCTRRAALNGHMVLANIFLKIGMTMTETNVEITAPEVELPEALRPEIES